MSFRDRVEAARAERAEEARAAADAEAREHARRKAAVVEAAAALLDEVYEAVSLLRVEQERSKLALRWDDGLLGRQPAGGHAFGGFGQVVADRSRFLRRVVNERVEFAGWWAREDAFQLEVPLAGEPSVRAAERVVVEEWAYGRQLPLSEFVDGAIYRFRTPVGEQELSEQLTRTADEALRTFVHQIERHLVSLGP